MSSRLSKRLQDSAALFSACQVALPSWAGASLSAFSCSKLSGGFSSPGLYLVSCTAQGAAPDRAVVKLDVESMEHPFYQFYQAGLILQGTVCDMIYTISIGPGYQ